MKEKILVWCIGAVSLFSIGFGAIYLFCSHIMSYHTAFLEMDDATLNAFNPRILLLYLALMKIAGICYIAQGITSLLVAISFWRHKVNEWTLWLITFSFIITLIVMFLVTFNVAQMIPKGQPQPPWWLTAIFLVILGVMGTLTILNEIDHKKKTI